MDEWAALIGVGGTLAGAALVGFLGQRNEHARWEREQDARWADDRRALYSKVIAECDHVANEVRSRLLTERRDQLITFGELLAELRPSQDRLRPLIAELELIGTDDDAEAAQQLLFSAETLLQRAIRNPDEVAEPGLREWADARAEFRRRARSGLHLAGPQSRSQSRLRVGWWRRGAD
ncbi:MAG TPA: hypothetical protein VKT78_10190 [Fimbriimonadaceae bacterium]|nr:hypothetical protein [Fimbriimonadaceae bacterium]